MKTFFAAIASLVALTAVTGAAEPTNCFVLTGAFSKVTEEAVHRVTTAEEWERIWQMHVGPQRVPVSLDRPTVDFANYMVIACFLGKTINTEGIALKELSTEGRNAVINIDILSYQSMGDGDDVTPYAFLVVPRTTNAIAINVDARGLQERAAQEPPEWKQYHTFSAIE